MKPYKLLAFVMCLALILSACVPAPMAPVQLAAEVKTTELAVATEKTAITEAESPPEPHGLRPDAPTYAVRGPYAVGARNYSIQDGDHTIQAVVWYPALNPSNAKEEITYAISASYPDMAGLPIKGQALQDAAPDTAHGPYPLVIFSGGLTAWSQAYSYLSEHLASRGFVVMASDPRGETFEEFWAGAATRPLDTNRLIASADELTAAGGGLAGLIDTEHIAVAGHSSGGWTALVGGGAQFDWGWCGANPDIVAENELSNCTQFVPHQQEVASLLGLASVPTGTWPQMNDPRVDAIVAMAPDGDIWGADYQGVANVKVPTLIMAGTGDTTNIPERCAYPVYEHLGSAKKHLIKFEGADHMVFGNQCRDAAWLPFAWCSDTVWDMDRAHDLINHFVTAFLLAELKGDTVAAAALAPDKVSFPGIRYQSAGYGAAVEPEAKLDGETIAKIEALVQQKIASGQAPGAAVGVVKDGELVYAKGFGVAELGSDKPVTPDSVFSMASVSKSVVGTAVMQLVSEGKIDLDAPVTKYLPYFALADPASKTITVRQLLIHKSGLREIPDWIPEFNKDKVRTDDGALEAYVRSLTDEKLLFPPGKEWSYSSIAFDVLGDVIAKASGQSFEAYAQEHILGPLGMKHSSFLRSEVDPGTLTSPHMVGKDGKLESISFFPYNRIHAPGATLFSSVNDMARLAIASMNHGELDGVRVLPASAYDEMWAPQAASTWAALFGPPVTSYGLGWWVGQFNGHAVIGNYGAVTGFQSHLAMFPKKGIAVVAMVNVFDPGTGAMHAFEIGNGMAEVLLGVEPEPATRAYQPRYEAAACKYPVPDGEKMACGYLTVPEDRSKPDGPAIRLHVTNYKSTSPNPALDPVFIVAGGAGTSGMSYQGAILGLPFGKALRAERDVIFLDQRGTNFSEPALYCTELAVNPADVADLPLAQEVAARVEKIRACHDRLVKEGINLAAYNEMEIAADFADLRVAMGYDKINLYAMSLGTRLAMIAMRDHREGLRSVVLDSVLPPEVNILASDLLGVQAALKALFEACAADAACKVAYPDLEAVFYEVAGRLRAAPAQVEATTDKGERFKVAVDDLSFVEYVLDSLFNRAIASTPASIYAARSGDCLAVAKARLAPARFRQPAKAAPGSMVDADGLWYSFWCTGDGGSISDADLNAAFGAAGLNPSVRDRSWAVRVEAIHAPCASWKVPVLDPRIADQPVTSDIPTLLLEGTFDFFTEPSLVQASTKRLSKSYFHSLPTGHLIAWFSPCGEKLAIDFLRDPTKAPDASCIGEMKVAWVLPK